MSEAVPPLTHDPSAHDPSAHGPSAHDEDAELAALFAARLPPEPLPPAALERLAHRVLNEVEQTLPAVPAPAAIRAGGEPLGHRLRSALERLRAWLRSLSPNQSLLLASAGALAAMLIFIGISRITPRPLTTTAAVNGGSATVLNSSNQRFRIQQPGDQLRLRQGDRVLTDSGSVQLVHFPNHTTVIEPGADVELTHLGDEGGGLQLALTVHDGLVRSTLDSPLGTNDAYLIYAPGITVAAVGTDFVVEAVNEQETHVMALEGHVAVTMGKQTVTIGPGQEVDAVVGKTLAVHAAGGE